MVVVILLGFLIAIWLYIRWDGKRLRNYPVTPLARSTMGAGYKPGGVVTWQVYVAAGCMAALLAFMEWNAPSRPPFSGRWAFVESVLFETFGSRGILTTYVAIAAAFLCAAGSTYLRGKR